MTNATITLSGVGAQDIQELNLQISVEASVQVGATPARRTATVWLASEVGNMLMAGPPQLVIAQRTVWRFPVLATSSAQGVLGEVGQVDVDVTTGEALVNEELKTQILDNVQRLIRPALSPTG